MEKLLANEGDMKFIYLGDGNGDHCPSTKLREIDYCMPRKNYPLWGVIQGNPKLINANINGWTHGGDLEHVLLSIIHDLISNNKKDKVGGQKSLAMADFKLKNMPRPSHEVLPQALKVSQ